MTLATEGVRLSAEQFDELFPFHLVFDRRFALIEAGKSMRHLVGTLEPGSDIRPHFRVIKPDQLMGFDDMLQRRQSLFVMQIIATGTLLRGQMLHLAEQDCIAFLGSPWMTEPDELTKLDLTVNDFAIHDPIVDMLQLLQHTRSALADSKKLAEQLTSQQRELRKLALIASRTAHASSTKCPREVARPRSRNVVNPISMHICA